MPKLPKKKTMVETIARVEGYATKLEAAGNISIKKYITVKQQLKILKDAIEK
nr:MAG: hypothetical protein [uncultured archaeon]